MAALVALVPLPDRIIANGVVWTPETSQLRAGDDGFVDAVAVAGEQVAAGQSVVMMSSPALQKESQRLQARRDGLEATRLASLLDNPARSRQVAENLAQTDDALARVQERLGSLTVAAPGSGRLNLPVRADLPGRYFKRGEAIGSVIDDRPAIVRVVLAQDDVSRLHDARARVALAFAHAPWQRAPATMLRNTPAAIDRLPSAALAQAGGGTVETDPADAKHLKPLRPTYVIDVGASAASTPDAVFPGERVVVQFDCGWASLLMQASRNLRQTFRSQFAGDRL